MAQSSIPNFMAPAVAINIGTTSASTSLSGNPGVGCNKYYVQNNSSQEIWLVITTTANPTAVFPTPGNPQNGFAIPPNQNLMVSGAPCGNGATAYAAVIGASASGSVYITPFMT